MIPATAQEIRDKYLKYFKEKGHAVIPSASLIPENDPTVLFTTAGMHPLVPYLIGESHPAGRRLCNIQKCVRTGDIDEVGDTCHLTFFEMLGNWSLGDYFKKEAIEMSFEFLTSEKWLGISLDMLAFTVFKGDPPADGGVPADEKAADIWKGLGVPAERIAYLGKDDNWWGPAGETGPCGPDTEMFFWTGDSNDEILQKPFKETCGDKRWVEIWNDVFMQYNKTKEGKYEPLAQKNIDTGMGLERILAVLNGKATVYETDLFRPIIAKIGELSGISYGEHIKKVESREPKSIIIEEDEDFWNSMHILRFFHIIADHLRASTFILGDEKGIEPSNVGQGYVLRRLIRRAIRYGRQLGISEFFAFKVAAEVIGLMGETYPELRKNKDFIIGQIAKEEEKFVKTLEHGLKELYKLPSIGGAQADIPGARPLKAVNRVDAKEAFYIFQTFGFPLEMMQEELAGRGLIIDSEEFDKEFEKHQELSRTASAGMFKGGLADSSEETKKLHTAAHLMLAALRRVLGDHVYQKGSNITPERLRFDFSHPEKMTPEQIKQTEDLVNEQIGLNLPVKSEEMTLEEAKEQGAMGVFESKYGEKVKVYSIGDFSKEICGGPHAKNTGELGGFKISKEESSSAGVRRIKAVLTANNSSL